MKDLFQAIVFICLFAVPFLPVYVENDFFFPFITGKNFAFRIIVEVAFASWAILALYDAKYRPKFSWILAGFSALLAVMLVANAMGEYPLKSFWSNFERMDGYITLVHVFMYMTVLSSFVKKDEVWFWFLNVSLAVALWVGVYGLMQHAGLASGNSVRIDSKLGNAAYMAIYMLFHIFIAFYLFVRAKTNMPRVVYALMAIIFAYALLLTGTRGTFLGFVGGSFVAIAYVAVFGRKYPAFRKIAAGGFVAMVLFAGAFFALRDSSMVQDSLSLSRIANIDIAKDLETRGVIWGMAMEGVKERPLLGWGQGNFNYVFNEQFEPVLWNKEAWFDRVHNIFLDWLIAGGVLGLLAYLSIFVAAFYYLFWQPMRTPEESHTFNTLERAVLLGLLAGYFVHNLVVFDNIISYIFFGTILALVHYRVASDIPSVQNWKIDERMVTQFAMPIIVLMAGAVVWFANAPGIGAAGDIIDALRQQSPQGRLAEFEEAIARDTFARQEIVEQLSQNAINVARTQGIPDEQKIAFVNAAERELKALVEEKPGDARLHVFFATFYRSVNQFEKAREQAAIARTLAPRKQAVIIEQGVVELQLKEVDAAKEFFKQAYELHDTNYEALVLYAALLVETGESDLAKELIGAEYIDEFASNDYALNVVNRAKDNELLTRMFEERVKQKPKNVQNRASLSFLYYQEGRTEDSIRVLEEAAVVIPEFAPRANCYIGNIQTGKTPEEGC